MIKVAEAGGGYIEYYYNDPIIIGDEDTGSPKISLRHIPLPREMAGRLSSVPGYIREPLQRWKDNPGASSKVTFSRYDTHCAKRGSIS